jgi:hypothetical protein
MTEWKEFFENVVIPFFQEIKDVYEKKGCKVEIFHDEVDTDKDPAAKIKINHKHGDFEYAMSSALASEGGRLYFEVMDTGEEINAGYFPSSIDKITKDDIKQNLGIEFRKWQNRKWPERKI